MNKKIQQEASLKTVKDAIPETCFESSLSTSLSYLFRDIAYTFGLVLCASHIHCIPYTSMRMVAWLLYGFLQGCVGVGLWILAHECGHGAFSSYSKVNNLIGWTLHSALLVPYFSWKITHARHHRFTSHMEKDTVFVPCTAAEYKVKTKAGTIGELLEDAPLATALRLLGHQLFGFPMYLLFNLSAGSDSLPTPKTGMGVPTSHFNPLGGLFMSSQWVHVVLSDLGIVATFYILASVGQRIGLENVLLFYAMPYVWVNHWIVAITYLHHTHPDIPHYGAESWTYTKGALATVDRSLGFIGRHLFHEIVDFHVIHHLFPTIPFYKAEEATTAARNILGSLYREQKDENFYHSFFQTFSSCKFVSSPLHGEAIFHWETAKL